MGFKLNWSSQNVQQVGEEAEDEGQSMGGRLKSPTSKIVISLDNISEPQSPYLSFHRYSMEGGRDKQPTV